MSQEQEKKPEQDAVENTEEINGETVLTEDEISKMKADEQMFKESLNKTLSMVSSKVQLDLILTEINGMLIRNGIAADADEAAAYFYKLSKKVMTEGKDGVIENGEDSLQWIISPLDNNIIIIFKDGTVAYHNVATGVVVNGEGAICSDELSERLNPYFGEFNSSISEKVTELMKIDASRIKIAVSEAVPLEENASEEISEEVPKEVEAPDIEHVE